MKQASFKGVFFYIQTDTLRVHRRSVVHTFPYTKDTVIEDLGVQPREIDIEAFVIGSKHSEDYRSLIAAAESAGSGTLVHPELGAIECVCTSATQLVRKHNRQGMTSVRMRLIEVSQGSTSMQVDPSALVTKATDAVERANADTFVAQLKGDINPRLTLQTLSQHVRALLAKRAQFTSAVQDITNQLTALERDVTSLLDTPSVILSSLQGALLTLVASGVSVKQTAQRNLAATQWLTQATLVANAHALFDESTETAQPPYTTKQLHKRTRDLLDQITKLEQTASDDTYMALHALYIALAQALPTLPTLSSHLFSNDIPAVVQLYEIAGDVTAIDDYIALNEIAHPLFAHSEVVWNR